MEDRINFNVSFGRRVVLFLCLAVLCYLVGGGIIYLITAIKGMTPVTMRISAVLQDLIVFIVPAVAMAVIITRLPARFLSIERGFSVRVALLACGVLLVSMPALNTVIAWNESISLPSSLSGIETSMRQAELTSRMQIAMLLGEDTVGGLIVAILIVGVMAALAEELFFRGAFQRLLTTGGVNVHLAVFLVAFVFSAMHFQFYGFFGRLLLGMYFGYLLVWSRSLWIPVIVHVFNNTVYIIANRGTDTTAIGTRSTIDNFGVDEVGFIIGSVILTVAGIVMLIRITRRS